MIKYLLCRCATGPCLGFWIVPTVYLELNKCSEEENSCETQEESNAEIIIEALLAVYSIPHIIQIQLIYVAHLNTAAVVSGYETIDLLD